MTPLRAVDTDVDGALSKGEMMHLGGLRDGENVDLSGATPYWTFAPAAGIDVRERMVCCEYENRFGDVYRVEVPLRRTSTHADHGPERFLVGIGNGDWLPVNAVVT
jgi:hypothetical protein